MNDLEPADFCVQRSEQYRQTLQMILIIPTLKIGKIWKTIIFYFLLEE